LPADQLTTKKQLTVQPEMMPDIEGLKASSENIFED
jgi:hypothetical protein